MGRKKGSPYRSALSDNVRPGAPTTMDVLIRWITKPGNVRRWRMEPRAPLVREIVDIMQKEGLAHRQAPFVRYKLEAIEKQYIIAKQWLLETGMHDSYMKGKATKEVRVNVDRACPQFRTLDPAFRGVPFNKKNAETIELDEDSAEDVEAEEKEEGESEEIGEEEAWEEDEEKENEEEHQSKKVEEKTAVESQQKRQTFRGRLFPDNDNVEKEKAPMPNEERQKKAQTFRNRLFAQKENVVEKEKASTSAKPQQKNGNIVRESIIEKDNVAQEKVSPPAASQKTSAMVKRLASSSGYAAAEKVRSSKTTGPQEERTVSIDQPTSSAGNVAGKEKASKLAEPKKKNTREHILTAAVQVAMEQAAPEAAKSAPASAPKRRGRPPKSAAVVPPTPNGAKETAQAANGKNATASKTKVAVPPTSNGAKMTAQAPSGKYALASNIVTIAPPPSNGAKETAQAPNGKNATTSKTKAAKRKNSDEETTAVKRTRTQVQNGTEREDLLAIERAALLKRVNDEEKQRQEMYMLEQAKIKCELESKQVQLLFEKAAARKKLDQLGVSKEEIDRILPL